jgi:hypothetical protein
MKIHVSLMTTSSASSALLLPPVFASGIRRKSTMKLGNWLSLHHEGLILSETSSNYTIKLVVVTNLAGSVATWLTCLFAVGKTQHKQKDHTVSFY